MKTLPSLAIAFLLFFNCGSDFEFQTAEMPPDIADALTLDQTSEMQPPLTDVLTFELSFGAEDLPDEYLLAMISISLLVHYVVTVDNENNVYVFDENRLKVYDENGKPKAIIGGPGEGPGEFLPTFFNRAMPTVGPNGYITVFNFGLNTFYNMYGPQHKFVKRVNKKPMVTGKRHNCKVITINEDEYIGEVFENHPKGNLLTRTFSIEYSKNEEKITVASYDIATDVIYRGDHKSLPNTGDLFWDLLPGRKVIYTHTRQDEIYTSEGNFYIIHIYDLDSGERKVFKKRFTPVTLDDMIGGGGSSGGGV